MAQHLDSRCVLLSDPSTKGAGGPNQNTSRIRHHAVQTTFGLYCFYKKKGGHLSRAAHGLGGTEGRHRPGWAHRYQTKPPKHNAIRYDTIRYHTIPYHTIPCHSDYLYVWIHAAAASARANRQLATARAILLEIMLRDCEPGQQHPTLAFSAGQDNHVVGQSYCVGRGNVGEHHCGSEGIPCSAQVGVIIK